MQLFFKIYPKLIENPGFKSFGVLSTQVIKSKFKLRRYRDNKAMKQERKVRKSSRIRSRRAAQTGSMGNYRQAALKKLG